MPPGPPLHHGLDSRRQAQGTRPDRGQGAALSGRPALEPGRPGQGLRPDRRRTPIRQRTPRHPGSLSAAPRTISTSGGPRWEWDPSPTTRRSCTAETNQTDQWTLARGREPCATCQARRRFLIAAAAPPPGPGKPGGWPRSPCCYRAPSSGCGPGARSRTRRMPPRQALPERSSRPLWPRARGSRSSRSSSCSSRRRPRDEQEPERLLFPWWAKTAGVLLALGLLVTPFVVLLSLKVRKHTPVPPVAHLVNPVSRSQPPNAAAQSSAWPLIAGLVIAIAGVLTLTCLTRRRRLPGRPQNRVDRAVGLAEGLAAGSAALQANHEPPAAIIACYAAMEQGFAAAGSAPAAADTPVEVLARATAAGIVRSGSAEVLTGLFRRARYSDEPMTSADSAAAATALVQGGRDRPGPDGADNQDTESNYEKTLLRKCRHDQ